MNIDKRLQDFRKEVEKLKEIDGAEEYAKQLAHLFLGNGLSLQTILLMAIDFGQQHPNWIPVEERKPEIPKNDWKSDNVLFVVNGEIFYGYRGKYTWFAPFVSFNNHEVTHWMEIVPPRKEE